MGAGRRKLISLAIKDGDLSPRLQKVREAAVGLGNQLSPAGARADDHQIEIETAHGFSILKQFIRVYSPLLAAQKEAGRLNPRCSWRGPSP